MNMHSVLYLYLCTEYVVTVRCTSHGAPHPSPLAPCTSHLAPHSLNCCILYRVSLRNSAWDEFFVPTRLTLYVVTVRWTIRLHDWSCTQLTAHKIAVSYSRSTCQCLRWVFVATRRTLYVVNVRCTMLLHDWNCTQLTAVLYCVFLKWLKTASPEKTVFPVTSNFNLCVAV
jgi:hypothetical protein